MSQKILIGYESATGTTKEVCEIISSTLVNAGYEVTLTTISAISDLAIYDHVLLASPINGMSWLEGSKEFLQKQASVLKDKDVGLIFVSYILKHGNGFWKKTIRRGMTKLADPINATLIQGFGGKVSEPFGTVPRMIFGISKEASPDARNFDEVKSFAKELSQKWQ